MQSIRQYQRFNINIPRSKLTHNTTMQLLTNTCQEETLNFSLSSLTPRYSKLPRSGWHHVDHAISIINEASIEIGEGALCPAWLRPQSSKAWMSMSETYFSFLQAAPGFYLGEKCHNNLYLQCYSFKRKLVNCLVDKFCEVLLHNQQNGQSSWEK